MQVRIMIQDSLDLWECTGSECQGKLPKMRKKNCHICKRRSCSYVHQTVVILGLPGEYSFDIEVQLWQYLV